MAKCGGCGKYMSSMEGAKCDKCRSLFHRQCVGIRDMAPISTPWHCPECKRNVPRDNRPETPVRGHAPPDIEDSLNLMDTTTSPINNTALDATQELHSSIRTELKLFKDEFINTVRHEFRIMRHELTELKAAINNANDRLTNLEERVTVIENQQTQAQPSGSSEVGKIIAQLRSDINDRDQELLANDIQISNLPEVSGENPVNTALLVAAKMGINMEARDVVCAERVGGRRITAVQSSAPVVTRPRFLIVRLARRDLREQLLEGARARRGMTSADLDIPGPAVRFYVNERLTKPNRELFRRAREAGGRYGWQFVWFKRGRVLARNKPGESACIIRCEADIQRIFGPMPVVSGESNL